MAAVADDVGIVARTGTAKSRSTAARIFFGFKFDDGHGAVARFGLVDRGGVGMDFEFADGTGSPGKLGEITTIVDANQLLIVAGKIEGRVAPNDLAGFGVYFEGNGKFVIFLDGDTSGIEIEARGSEDSFGGGKTESYESE